METLEKHFKYLCECKETPSGKFQSALFDESMKAYENDAFIVYVHIVKSESCLQKHCFCFPKDVGKWASVSSILV